MAAPVVRVMAPLRSEVPTAPPVVPVAPPRATPDALLKEILMPVAADMQQMNENLRNVVGNRHPMLMAAADQIFGAGGKKLRPMLVFLVARATAQLAGLRWVRRRYWQGHICCCGDLPVVVVGLRLWPPGMFLHM